MVCRLEQLSRERLHQQCEHTHTHTHILQRAELEAELSLAQAHLDELRNGGKLTTQSQMDSAQVELREAGTREAAIRSVHDEVCTWCTCMMRWAHARRMYACNVHDEIGTQRMMRWIHGRQLLATCVVGRMQPWMCMYARLLYSPRWAAALDVHVCMSLMLTQVAWQPQ